MLQAPEGWDAGGRAVRTPTCSPAGVAKANLLAVGLPRLKVCSLSSVLNRERERASGLLAPRSLEIVVALGAEAQREPGERS